MREPKEGDVVMFAPKSSLYSYDWTCNLTEGVPYEVRDGLFGFFIVDDVEVVLLVEGFMNGMPFVFADEVPDDIIDITVDSDEPKASHDPVNHPNHYDLPDEVIKLIRRNLTPEEFRGYCKGNILKYTCRSALKNGAEDWAKAGIYMNWLEEEQ